MATHSSILIWRIPWTEEPGELPTTELQRVRHDGSNVARTHARTMASKYQGFMFDYNFHLSFKFPHSDHSLGFTVLCQFRSFKVSSRKPSRRVEAESRAFKNITAIRKIRRTWLCLNRK